MYPETETWNPFKGCEFDCLYCRPSLQQQAKRLKHLCTDCYDYRPHTHPDRLDAIPRAEIVLVCGNADISFCDPTFTRRIIQATRRHRGATAFYFQSKQPEYFAQFLS